MTEDIRYINTVHHCGQHPDLVCLCPVDRLAGPPSPEVSAPGNDGDLDAVIDGAGVRLLGVVPEDFSLAASFLQGKKARADSPGMKALSRVAGRLEGESIPLAGF